MWLGFVQIQTNRASRAIGELEQALSLNRNLGAAHAWIGLAKITMGRAEEAESHVDQAFRLSPTDAVAFMWTHVRGLAKFHLGADEEAVALFRRSVDSSRNYPLNHFYMAAALANLGRIDEAQAEVKAGHALAPNYSDRAISQHGGERQPDLSRATRAHPRGASQSRRSGKIIVCPCTPRERVARAATIGVAPDGRNSNPAPRMSGVPRLRKWTRSARIDGRAMKLARELRVCRSRKSPLGFAMTMSSSIVSAQRGLQSSTQAGRFAGSRVGDPCSAFDRS